MGTDVPEFGFVLFFLNIAERFWERMCLMDIASEINKKDVKVFRKFFDANFSRLVLFTDKYLDNIDVAADVAQESFIQLWRSDVVFTSEDKIRGFLYTTARNLALNHIKHAHIVSAYLLQHMEEELFTRDNIIEQETYQLVHAAINQLASQSKKIIIFSLQGLSNQEIADKMGISVNTVRTLKQNAYKKLKQLLKDHFYIVALLLKMQVF